MSEQGQHDTPISLLSEYRQLQLTNDMGDWRVEIQLTSGVGIWVKALTEEWEDAVRIIREQSDKPEFLMKHTIQGMRLTRV
jgi:hypothetical protein